MRVLVFGIFASVVGVWGCQSPVTAPTLATSPASASPVIVSGQSVALTLKSAQPNITLIYEGLVKEIDDETIVLGNATRITRREAQPPPRGRLPFVGRAGRNAGVGIETLPGEVTLRRRDLVAIDPAPQTLPNAAERLRIPAPENNAESSEAANGVILGGVRPRIIDEPEEESVLSTTEP